MHGAELTDSPPDPDFLARFFQFLADLFWGTIAFVLQVAGRFLYVLFGGGGPASAGGWWEL